MHKIGEELVEKLKFEVEGEPKGKPTYGMSILEAMLSREIKEFADYINYLAMSRNAESGAPTLGRGWGKGYMSRGGLEVNAPKNKKVEVLRRPRTITVVDNPLEDPDKTVDLAMSVNLEENKQREKEHRSKARHADLVLDKEVKKEVDEAYNAQLKFKLKAHEQGPGEGSSAVPDSLYHSDSSNSSIWESCDDDKTESDNDIDKK
ncbi:hypothetical protein Tco_0240924, partial [Tanacetum coccineum]